MVFLYDTTTKPQFATDVKEHVLDNGFTLWLNEDHNLPKIFGAIVVKAGSKDSPDTGIAHYFEHIMFKGTDKIGTVDYTAEKVFLDRISDKYDELATTVIEAQRLDIQREIHELSLLAADYVIPNEFDKLISRYGGSNLNAGTSYDYTVYHNIFAPEYIEHWAELNSERLLNPVFRMFQSELETVYEEKNRRDDMMFNQAMEKAFALYFHPHPYAYPVIGSAANLKNPRLSEMRRFFENYYVACNMGLVLCGDFDTNKVLPILSKAFSRLPQGVKPHTYIRTVPPFRGREKHTVKIPVPLMKVMALGFRGTPANHPDQAALNVAIAILNNSNGTGYLDRLTVRRRLMGAIAGGETLNEAGMLGFIIMPKLMIQTYKGAEKLVLQEISRIRNNDFSDEMFESLKQEQLRKYLTDLEDIDSRSMILIRLFTQNKTYSEYITELNRMEALTRDDVVTAARKYLNDNYILIRKKTGKYMKEYLPKPNFAPVVPKNSNATSKYAASLEQLPVQEVKTHFLDFDNDIKTLIINPLTTLYAAHNPVNNIFTLKMSYCIGTLEKPLLKHLASFLTLLGTNKYSFNEFRTQLQRLGSIIHFEATDNYFTLNISGFDKFFSETVVLLNEFITTVKYDRRKYKTLIDEARVGDKAFFKSPQNIADALFEYVRFGTNSKYLQKPSLKELKRMSGYDLLALFDEIRQIKCDFHYCGTLEPADVAEIIRRCLPLDVITHDTNIPLYREPIRYDRPLIFIYDISDVYQNILYGCQEINPLQTPDERASARLFSEYFGGGMSSLIFQEIREFRSYAYQTSGGIQMPPFCLADKPASFITFLSTQSDKTTDALKVLEALTRRMPAHPEKIESVKQSIISEINNEYPSFRDISTRIARYRHVGFNEDPNIYLLKRIREMNIDDVMNFYNTQIQTGNMVYTIVGNTLTINLSKLSAFGDIIRVKKGDFYR
ncbi:MAG: insulinase family protein [Tannerella sp.]|jgi:predicted Zn-dependent peptidase|nr:insulinase family protein [Tannerella sp.]